MSTAERRSSNFDNPTLTSEQQELKELLHSFFTSEFPLAVARQCYEDGEGNKGRLSGDGQVWNKLSQLGLEEAFSGKDSLGVAELAIVAQEVGSCCVPAALIEHLYFSRVIELEGITAPVTSVGERSSQSTSDLKRLTGYFKPRQAVAFGGEPSTIVELNCVEQSLRFIRAVKSARSPLDRTQGVVIDSGEQIGAVVQLKEIERHERIYRLLKAGESLGAAAHAVQMTRDYVLERKQFGVQIATFQALQHKLADMYRFVEQMQSLYRFAGWAASHSPAQEPLVSLSAIKFIYNHAVEVLEGAIQLHGGIGFTWEYDLHLLLRRAKMNEALLRLSDADNKLLLQSSC